jgi:hypothetical protein
MHIFDLETSIQPCAGLWPVGDIPLILPPLTVEQVGSRQLPPDDRFYLAEAQGKSVDVARCRFEECLQWGLFAGHNGFIKETVVWELFQVQVIGHPIARVQLDLMASKSVFNHGTEMHEGSEWPRVLGGDTVSPVALHENDSA